MEKLEKLDPALMLSRCLLIFVMSVRVGTCWYLGKVGPRGLARLRMGGSLLLPPC